jgi:hypothetical protein
VKKVEGDSAAVGGAQSKVTDHVTMADGLRSMRLRTFGSCAGDLGSRSRCSKARLGG